MFNLLKSIYILTVFYKLQIPIILYQPQNDGEILQKCKLLNNIHCKCYIYIYIKYDKIIVLCVLS